MKPKPMQITFKVSIEYFDEQLIGLGNQVKGGKVGLIVFIVEAIVELILKHLRSIIQFSILTFRFSSNKLVKQALTSDGSKLKYLLVLK